MVASELTPCPTCATAAPMYATVVDGDTLVVCTVCDTALTLGELVARAYLRGLAEARGAAWLGNDQ